MTRHVSFLGTVSLAALAVGCASSGTTAPVAAPAPAIAPPAPAEVAAEPAIESIEPGRFDMGKMWTFENAPVQYFEQAYGFRATKEWLDQVRLASLRIPGCTASFVSGEGLVLSNHHCARGATSAVTKEGENLLDDGFYAATLSDERPADNMWADQLVRMEDVTDLIERGIDPTASEAEQLEAIEMRIELVDDSTSALHALDCGVTSLYQGGKYSLYCYRRYNDVRLVFVPELQIGYFGGDPDNFTYPRYNLDFSLFRIYDEAGQPLRPANYFRWTRTGVTEGDAVFVIGNPGSTERLSTMAQLEFARDYNEPFTTRLLKTRTDILAHFMEHHPDQRSRYINQWFGWMNGLKLYQGRTKALNDPAIMGRKLGFERQFRADVAKRPELQRAYGSLWDEIADIQSGMAEVFPTLASLGTGGSIRSQTLGTAALMMQYAQMAAGGAPDSIVQSVRSRLDGTDINRDLDGHMLEAQIGDVTFFLGEDDPWVEMALAGRAPLDAARAIIAESPSVVDPEARRVLLDDPASIMSSAEPAFALVQAALPRVQQAGAQFQMLAVQEQTRATKLARALFEVYGTEVAPDATFTLRIADGVVSGYEYNGTLAPAYTTFYGLYDRWAAHKGREEWALPERWHTPPPELDLSTPVNMVHTNDTVGGNSGSPVINIDRELVGLLFDGNIESLSGDFIYTTEGARSVSVRADGILEALRHVYGADRIVRELVGR